MRLKQRKILILPILFLLFTSITVGQKKVLIDQIAARVGDKKILQSDIENQILQLKARRYSSSNMECEVFQDLLSQKLLLIQAEKDSLEVSANQINAQLERRLQYFIRQIGSQKKLEEYYDKSMPEIKQDLREMLEEQMLTQKMRRELVSDIDVSPNEVKSFYKSLPEDSIPMINEKVQINQIIKYPEETEESEARARKKLLELRKRILDGEKFSTLAVLYSDDPASARKGGELGLRTAEELDPAFADAAFGLQEGEVSGIVESSYGYHIIKLVSREGDQVNVRHILKTPEVSFKQKQETRKKLDSIARLVRSDKISFEKAALKFSEDRRYRLNGGLLVNPQDASHEFTLDQLPSSDYDAVKDLKVGEVSEPFEAKDEKGHTIFKIIRLKDKIPSHRANLKEDFEVIRNLAKQREQQKTVKNWLNKKQQSTYIHIDEDFKHCELESLTFSSPQPQPRKPQRQRQNRRR
jgi:peptidyl-prolyl cis-trans isomerase SurA